MDPNNPPPQIPPPMPPPSGPAGNLPPPAPLNQPQPWQPIAAQPAPAPTASAKQEVVERLKQANNVLITVSNNPSVDQLAACIGVTLLLNKIGKHGTAVFSGAVPSTIEFLKPEETIEKNTDSLRDFIIALDKAKADKLRYKIEDKYVKIFITPYRTSLGEQDLEFSQGDFNVEVVLAIGVTKKEELDQAITAHGRILHDATVISVNNQQTSDIGAINWRETGSSSLCELMVSLGESLKPNSLDAQIATSFLTGIVAETDRFSNNKTSAVTMGIASQLMKAGANQQLIATKLEEPLPVPEPPVAKKPPESSKPIPHVDSKKTDGTLQVPHEEKPPAPPPIDLSKTTGKDVSLPGEDDSKIASDKVDRIRIDEQGELHSENENLATINQPPAMPQPPVAPPSSGQGSTHMVLQPPTHGGTLTANTTPELEPPSADPLSQPANAPAASAVQNLPTSDFGSNTVDSRLFGAQTPPTVAGARQGVNAAQNGQSEPLKPIAALNAQPIDLGQNSPAGNPTSAQGPTGPPPPVPPPMMPPTA